MSKEKPPGKGATFRQRIMIRLIMIAFGLSIGCLLGYALKRLTEHNFDSQGVEIIPGKQAAKFIFHPSPFYYPNSIRSTHMSVTEPFTEITNLGRGRHNSQGFRTLEYCIAHPPDTFRIVVIGDSVAWGQGVAIEQTFSHRLRVLLTDKCKGASVETISLGVQGHRLADNFLKLVVHAQALDADIILFQVYPNDVELYDYASILRFQGVQNLLRAYRARQDAVYKQDSADWKVFQTSISAIKAWSTSRSVPVGFVVFPLLDTSRTGRNFQHYNPEVLADYRKFSSFNNAIREIRKAGFPVLDLVEEFRATAGDEYLAVSATDGHPNALAHRIAAEALVPFVNGIVNCQTLRLKPENLRWKSEKKLRDQASRHWSRMNQSYLEQRKFYQELLDLYPENAWIAMQTAHVYFELNQRKEAFEIYKSLTRLLPQYSAPWYQMANSAEDPALRAKLLEDTVKILPDHPQAIEELAEIYLKQQRVEHACQLLFRVSRIPYNAKHYSRILDLLNRHGCKRFVFDREDYPTLAPFGLTYQSGATAIKPVT